MSNIIPNKEQLEAVTKNISAFVIIILLAANAYQYVHNNKTVDDCNEKIQKLNDANMQLTYKMYETEKTRNDRLEYVFGSLFQKTSPITNANK
jgi:hypothetical protein